MRTCWKAGRAAISSTLAAASGGHNSVFLLEKKPEEASEAQLLCCFFFFPGRGGDLALLPSTCTLLDFFQTSLSISHNQINLTLWFPASRTTFCRRPFPGQNNTERGRQHLLCSQLKCEFSKELSSGRVSSVIFGLPSLHCPSVVRPLGLGLPLQTNTREWHLGVPSQSSRFRGGNHGTQELNVCALAG